jgi:N-methylhydantoinase B
MNEQVRSRALDRANVDPITLQIIRHELVSVPNQIEKNIERTAFSPLVQEYKDYSVGFVDKAGRLVAQSRGSLPIFVANALGTAVRHGLSIFGEDDLRSGDVVISNDPGTLGQHLNNVVAYTPVRVDGALIGFFAVLVHWIDLGGIVPGSCQSTSTTDIWQEGIQFPSIKLISEGRRLPDIFRLIASNTRFPRLLLGDLEAQLGGCIVGRQLVTEIVQKHGIAAVESAIEDMWEAADAAVAQVLKNVPPGVYTASSFLDDDGIRFGTQVPVEVRVAVEDGAVTVDLSGVADQVKGPFNAGRNGGAVAAARIAFKYLFAPDTPVNEGDFRRLKVEIPDGKFLSARPDAPIGGSGAMMPTVVDTILKAMASAFPDRVAAAHHGIYGVHSIFGSLPKTGERFHNLDTVTGGWGASARDDGPGPFRSAAHGDVPDVPIEMQEALYPFRVESKRLLSDTGGPGNHRGGVGVEKQYRFLHPCHVLTKFDRGGCPPWGLDGGGQGKSGYVELTRADGQSERFYKGEREVGPGDVLRIVSGGGGGFGPPFERDPSAVASDVALGYVTRDRAASDYGVVIKPDGNVDAAETAKLRRDRSGKSQASIGGG